MKDKKITLGDRLASSFVMLLASFITGVIIWGFVIIIIGKAHPAVFPSFNYVLYATAFFYPFGIYLAEYFTEYNGLDLEEN